MSNDITSARPLPVQATQELAVPRPVKAAAPGTPEPQAPGKTEAGASQAQRPDPEASRRELRQAVERLNEQVKKNSYNLNFSVDEASRHLVVRVRTASGEVIRQIPDETVLRLAENMQDLKGLLQDEKI